MTRNLSLLVILRTFLHLQKNFMKNLPDGEVNLIMKARQKRKKKRDQNEQQNRNGKLNQQQQQQEQNHQPSTEVTLPQANKRKPEQISSPLNQPVSKMANLNSTLARQEDKTVTHDDP